MQVRNQSRPVVAARRRETGGVRPAILIVIALCVIAPLAGIGWWALNLDGASKAARDAPGQAPQWAVVKHEPIPVTVVTDGDLVAKNDIDIVNTIEHHEDERLKAVVEEGTWVEQGDWLYTLSAPGLVADRDEQESRLREAEAELEEAKRSFEIEKDIAASAEDQAQLALDLAQLAHKQWEHGINPQQVRDLNLALEKAQRELDQAKRELVFSKELFAKDFISRTELEEDEITLIEAENAMETAKLDIEVYNNYEKVKSEKELLSDITQAGQELARTKRKNLNTLELWEARIDSENNEVDQQRTRLKELERMCEAIEVNAPTSGLVIYSSTIGVGREKWVQIRPGAEIRGGHRVMVLSNTSKMVANLYVHESRINEIVMDQRVDVRVNARPDETFQAKVIEKKNSAIQSASGNPHLRQYLVRAELPPDLGDDIRPGMSCSGEIYIRNIPKALAVPIQAVHTEGGEHFVYVEAEKGKVRRQMIEMGGSSDTLVQVKSGLDVGARVLLRNPQPGEVLAESVEATPVAEQDESGQSSNT